MADGTVDMKFTGSAQDLERAIDRLEKKYEALTGQIKAGQRAARAGGGIVADMQKWATSVAAVVASYSALQQGMSAALSIQRELITASDTHADTLDKVNRKFQVQAGLTKIQGAAAQRRIEDLAVKNAVGVENAFGGATQLASSGVAPNVASGVGLDKILQGMAAMGQAGGDVETFTMSTTMMLDAAGWEKSAENIKKMMVRMSNAYKATNFQAADASQFAPKIQGMIAQGRSFEEAFSMGLAMRQVTTAEVATTGMKIFGERLAGGKKPVRKALAALGLNPDQVDMVGESSSDVLELLHSKLQAKPLAERAPLMQAMFGEAGTQVQGVLARGPDKYKDILRALGDEKAFDKDVKTAQSGRFAAGVRTKVQMELEQARTATDETLLFNQFEMEQRARGGSWVASKASRGIANMARLVGASPRAALSLGQSVISDEDMMNQGVSTYNAALSRTSGALGGEMPVGISKADEEYLKLMKENNDLLKQIVPKPAKRPVAVKPDE